MVLQIFNKLDLRLEYRNPHVSSFIFISLFPIYFDYSFRDLFLTSALAGAEFLTDVKNKSVKMVTVE